MKIGFFGDSFCTKEYNEHSEEHGYDTYIRQIKKHYNASIVNLGAGGSSVWDLYLQQLKPFIENNNIPDVSIFAWSHSGRLYHPIARSIHHTSGLAGFNKEKYKWYAKVYPDKPNFFKKEIWEAAKHYYMYLYDEEKEFLEYVSFLQYLDNNVFSKWPKDKKIIHTWSFGERTAKEEKENPEYWKTVNYPHAWKTGTEIRPPLMYLSAKNKWPEYPMLDNRPNHISGQEDNKFLANQIINAIDNYPLGIVNMEGT
jgi:hypothetical protein